MKCFLEVMKLWGLLEDGIYTKYKNRNLFYSPLIIFK